MLSMKISTRSEKKKNKKNFHTYLYIRTYICIYIAKHIRSLLRSRTSQGLSSIIPSRVVCPPRSLFYFFFTISSLSSNLRTLSSSHIPPQCTVQVSTGPRITWICASSKILNFNMYSLKYDENATERLLKITFFYPIFCFFFFSLNRHSLHTFLYNINT